jgi:hypothetical protein
MKSPCAWGKAGLDLCALPAPGRPKLGEHIVWRINATFYNSVGRCLHHKYGDYPMSPALIGKAPLAGFMRDGSRR